jgi:hypothetical protein
VRDLHFMAQSTRDGRTALREQSGSGLALGVSSTRLKSSRGRRKANLGVDKGILLVLRSATVLEMSGGVVRWPSKDILLRSNHGHDTSEARNAISRLARERREVSVRSVLDRVKGNTTWRGRCSAKGTGITASSHDTE